MFVQVSKSIVQRNGVQVQSPRFVASFGEQRCAIAKCKQVGFGGLGVGIYGVIELHLGQIQVLGYGRKNALEHLIG